MVLKRTNVDGNALVIVESPAKAKTIEKYLGSGFIVEASVGHVRDLPKGASEIPAKYRKEKWARLGVNVDANFEPIYIVPEEKVKQVAKLKDLMRNASSLYLATDEDREGEAISWHLLETLKPKKTLPVQRLVFHEITKSAILKALDSPRQVDYNLVKAQETRRILDRLFGYEASPILWYKIKNNLSAGRVQSVAVRLIVQREYERINFHKASYWDVVGMFSPQGQKDFQATLSRVDDKLIPSGKDFDPSTGNILKPEKFIQLTEETAVSLINRLQCASAIVDSVEEKPYATHPYPPFTTSALQQEANRKLNFTAKQTMSVAQSLYENGRITYMRTDSTNLSQEAISAARRLVEEHYGKEFLPASPRIYTKKVKNAQEAHEAIRPAGNEFPLPDDLRKFLSADEYRLYDLIWKRTVASQMADSIGKRKTIVVAVDNARFNVSGKTITFPGYLRAYVEGKDDPNAELATHEIVLPDVKKGESLQITSLTPQGHTTTPPQRYSEAALTHTLEEKGIGRPSTYASIIDVILNRNYVFKKNGALIPSWTAFAVCKLLETYFHTLVDYDFTADMENALDEISNGTRDRDSYLRAFYFGNQNRGVDQDGSTTDKFPFPEDFSLGLKALIEENKNIIDPKKVSSFLIGTPQKGDASDASPIILRVGRYGPFLEQDEIQANVPEDLPPDELTLAKAQELLDASKNSAQPIGYHPDDGRPIFLKHGRYGCYVQCGDPDHSEFDVQNASLLKGMTENDVTLEVALQLLALPKTLGTNPSNNESVVASNGRFGPYVKCGTETRSIPASFSVLTITLEQALELLAQEKVKQRASTAKATPLKTFGISPVTNQEIKLLNGRYGPYVTDGETNASLPKDASQEDLDFDQALALLAARAAKGKTVKKKSSVKSKASKKTASKKTTSASKKTGKKTATKKKSVRQTKTRVAGNSEEATF